MKNTCSDKTRGLCTAEVLANTLVNGKFYLLKLKLSGGAAKIFANAVPGQFIELSVDNLARPAETAIPERLIDKSQRNIILRRPFSFADVLIMPNFVQLDIMYSVLGPATLRMTTVRAGEGVSIIGPLGNGFSIPPRKSTALLLAGGMGAPPIHHLAKYIKEHHGNIKTVTFTGAKTANDLLFKSVPDNNSFIATDDGSEGFSGFVTDCLEQWLADSRPAIGETVIYACGPEPMLAKTAEMADKMQIDCQFSLERMMACGIGLCQSCAVKCKAQNSDEKTYKLCCKDGPVFDGCEIIW